MLKYTTFKGEIGMLRLEDIKRELDITNEELDNFLYVADNPERYNELCRKKNKLSEMYQLLTLPKVVSTDELDIYVENKGFSHYIYHLTLHEDIKEIGHIRVTYKECDDKYGNIGYEIKRQYQGHGFALKALELLEEEMIKRGLTNPIITAYPHNLPSIRTIEKFGGVLISESHNLVNYNKYQVDLLKKKEEKIKQKRKHLQ